MTNSKSRADIIFFKFLPAGLSLLALGAHYFRLGNMPAAIFLASCLILLGVRIKPVIRFLQLILFFGAIIWVNTTIEIAQIRIANSAPYTRLVIILSIAAALSLLGAVLIDPPNARGADGGADDLNKDEVGEQEGAPESSSDEARPPKEEE